MQNDNDDDDNDSVDDFYDDHDYEVEITLD